ncbi:hypothetical protein D5S18_01460 [Nocardia panacis]|uniref:HTH cro/C1-type domain-containing protein n=1 Tax=Nocardia panacis TaxID=2340916 RepID=A0A3A4L9L1_9NOCA|nr:hypothetical protein [Nocardia panacis]RJO79952.1 hypothetical protein D5S18_01460 [Nocardia panacis]
MSEAPLPLSSKVNRLFAVLHPRSAPERDNAAVAEQVSALLARTGAPIYLERLRRGERDTETHWSTADVEILAAIATAFGVAPDYLRTSGAAAAAIDRELELLATMRDANIASVALRGSAVDRAALARILDEVIDPPTG